MTAVGSGLQYTFLYASKLLCFSVAFCIYCVHLLYVNDRQPCEISDTDGVVVITCYVVLMREVKLKQVIAPGAATRYAPRRWQFDSRRIYVRPRTGPQSAHG